MASVNRSLSPSKFTHQHNLLRIRDRSAHPDQSNLFSLAVDLRRPESKKTNQGKLLKYLNQSSGKNSLNQTNAQTLRTGTTSINNTLVDLRVETGSGRSTQHQARVKIEQESGNLVGSWTDLGRHTNTNTVIKFNLRNPRLVQESPRRRQRSTRQGSRLQHSREYDTSAQQNKKSEHSILVPLSIGAGILRRSLDAQVLSQQTKQLVSSSNAEHQLSLRQHMARIMKKNEGSKSLETSRTAWMHGPGPHQRQHEQHSQPPSYGSDNCERFRIRSVNEEQRMKQKAKRPLNKETEIFKHVLAQQEGNLLLYPSSTGGGSGDIPEGDTFETDEFMESPHSRNSGPLAEFEHRGQLNLEEEPDNTLVPKVDKRWGNQNSLEMLGDFLSRPPGGRGRETSRSTKKSTKRGLSFNKIMETSEEKSSGVETGEAPGTRIKSSLHQVELPAEVYEQYPIALPSEIYIQQERDMRYQFTEFTAKYKQRLDNFLYEFFVREDGMLRCLRDGVPYLSPEQKQELDAIEANKRQQIQEVARVMFEMEELPPQELTAEAERFIDVIMGSKSKNKLLALADEEFQTVIPRLLRIEENTLKAMEGQNFKVDMRNGVSRYKNTLLPNELNEIEEFFNRTDRLLADDNDVGAIDTIVSRLEFFRKIDQEARYSLFREAILKKYDPEDFVVQQGEHGNSMFVILYGAANVLINGVHPKTKLPHKFIVASLVDGSSFGEYSLLSFPTPHYFSSTLSMDINELKSTLNPKGIKKILEVQKREHSLRKNEDVIEIERIGTLKMRTLIEERQKANFKEVVNSLKPVFVPNTRAASVQVYESAYMLEVSAELFKRSIVDKIREEMIEKIRLLSLQTYFIGHTNLNFVPIAMLMKKVDFKLGQTLIRKGETPSSLYIIKSGAVEVVNIMSRSREVNPKIYKNFIRRPLRSFNFEFSSNHGVDITTKQRLEEANRVKREQQEEDRKANMKGNTRLFVFDPVMGERTKSGFRKYYDFFVTKRLMTGDSLFTRCLHSKDISGDGNILTGVNPGIEKAKLSVIAASASVECYELKKNLIVFIPQPAKGILLSEVLKQPDHDIAIEPDTMKNIEFWDEFKEQEYISQMLEKQLTKKVDMFKKF